jgi:putative membrane protein
MRMVVLAQMMDRGDHMDNSNGWWWLMGILGCLILIALVVVIVLAFTHRPSPPNTTGPNTPNRRTADDLLAERLARGEIDEAEYRRRRDALRE